MNRKLTFLFLLFITSFSLKSQEVDSVAIEKTIINYIEHFFLNDFEQMNKSLHPRLAKRGIDPDRTLSDDYPPEALKDLMQKKQALPKTAQKNKVTDIKVFRDAATASLITGYPRTRWVEFIHLARFEGEWKIVNVMWEFFEKQD